MKDEKLLELVMIVKNSGDILKKCLNINKNFIDYWTIVDTGSTDNTCDIIKEELKDIPGKLHFIEFVDFCHTRNMSLELSSKSCKYTIILDDSYIIYGGSQLRKLLKKSKDKCFQIKIGSYINNNLLGSYNSRRIIKTSENLRFKYKVHEYIITDKVIDIDNKNIFIDDLPSKDHKIRSSNRYLNDIKLLKEDLENYPNDPRILYYIAKTYHIMDKIEETLYWYNKLILVNNLDSNYTYTYLYETACLNYEKCNDIDIFEKDLINISKKNLINRAEHLYKLAVLYKNKKNYKQCDSIMNSIINISNPKIENVLIDLSIYEFCIPYLYIEINLILNNIDKAVSVLKKLLNIYPTKQELLNIKYNLCQHENGSNTNDISSIKLHSKTLVIHTGATLFYWDPRSQNKKVSGSEIMAMNLAFEFTKLNYRVFIIGTFESEDKSLNYEGIHNSIEYIDHKYFSEFALTYIIDYLIISRDASNLIYYNNIKNVYLWIHDVIPIVSESCFQIHTNKFKYLISVSNWQKNLTCSKLNIPSEKIIVSRNAIYPSRFINKNIDKIPYRFIYSSHPSRGLNYLIEIITKIKEKYSDTTLYIYANEDEIDNDILKNITKLDYIYLNSRVSQEELAIELLKSDIFLYPTDFTETYCISALEAMASKCLVATVDLAGLGEIVKGKGITCKAPIKDNINDLIDKMFFVLDRSHLKNHFIETAYNWAIEQTYEKLAIEWEELFFLKNNLYYK